MVKHVIVDGSNIATEGRSKPSLKQLNEAVLAFLEEHPKVAVTVIVDASFGHRIDPKEVAAFDKAIEHNELVTPPAGTVGRGDAFVLSIAEKVDASILSNDSYQEFHGQYKWLFDEGRLIGGKPVPHVGWVFVERLPVRGEKSRMSERKSKAASSHSTGTVRKVSAAAMKPMPVPKSPPPGAKLPAKKVDSSKGVNEILPFLHFIESHGIGSRVEGIVESYSSHGAYVQIGDVRGYVPLRLLGNPPPRSAREAMKVGQTVTLEVVEIIASRRSVNLKPAVGGRAKKVKAIARAANTGSSTARKATAKKAAKKAAAPSKAPAKPKSTSKSTSVTKTATKTSARSRTSATSKKKVAVKATSAKKADASKKAVVPRTTKVKKTPAKR